jgi:hypothetical protein
MEFGRRIIAGVESDKEEVGIGQLIRELIKLGKGKSYSTSNWKIQKSLARRVADAGGLRYQIL